MARTHFQEWKRPIRIIQGNFTDSLTSPELSTYRPDYVLIDGNHRGQATITYFELLLPRMQAGGIMVFDDIRWSTDMTQAWQDIVQHPEVSVSIDLFTLGICFIRRPQAKAHFTFRYRFLP
ncbi:MAG: class I SAM-dependent methyltransferase [Bacteroidota bacterium]